MSNQNNNDDEKAIIALGIFFKIFALIATIFIIVFLIYITLHSEKSAESIIQYAFILAWSLKLGA